MSDEWDDVDLARALAWMRVAAGITLFLAPRFAAKAWTGERTEDFTTTMAVRGFGIRDAAIGIGLVLAIENGTPARRWIEAGALADAGDAIGTLAAWGDLPKLRALLWLGSQVAAAALGYRLSQSLD